MMGARRHVLGHVLCGGALAALCWASSVRAEGCETTQVLTASGPLRLGAPLPEFGGWTTTNELFSSARFRADHPGRALVISFFATWCEPCQRGLPVLEELQRVHADTLSVVLVAFAQDVAEVKPFLMKHRITLPVVLDTYEKQAKRFGVDSTLPRTFVASGAGLVTAVIGCEGKDFGDAVLRAAGDKPHLMTPPLHPR